MYVKKHMIEKQLKRALLLLLCMPLWLGAQDQNLAEHYFRNGEYEKAVSIYNQIMAKTPNEYIFGRVLECYINTEKYDEAEDACQKMIKKEPKKPQYLVQLGRVYKLKDKPKQAEEQFAKAIEKLSNDQSDVFQTASQFMSYQETDYAILAYEKGAKLLKDPYIFAMSLGELYRRKDNVKLMMETYINGVSANPVLVPNMQNTLARGMTAVEQDELLSQLMVKVGEEPNKAEWPELLSWLYLQKKDYKNAFRQLKALDRLLNEDGSRVIELADMSLKAEDWDAAVLGYEYIIDEKGPDNPYFINSKYSILTAKKNKIVKGVNYTKQDLESLSTLYSQYLSELGLNRNTAPILSDLAELNGTYLARTDSAISQLLRVIAVPGVDRIVQAKAKLALGDYYLISGDPWEATLLYSQVDKVFKDDELGQEARFKNAKLSYFKGDFEWARTQFDVLKSATSRLISNDAIDMSVFIMDNSGLDSITEPLQWYAEAELFSFQNRFEEMMNKLDDISRVYTDHNLADDILYLKARTFDKQRKTEEAVAFYTRLLETDKEGIWRDNSLFRLAEINEYLFKDKAKAMELYEKLFIDMSGSTFSVEARKRFRTLRGDQIQ
jgi:tetratricopeptide (TPR) repeat protein